MPDPRHEESGPRPGPGPGPGVARALPLLLVAIGTGVRIFAGHYARFTGDESVFWSIAVGIARGEAFPSFGPAMTGSAAMHPGPLFYYLMALPQLLGDSPLWGSGFIAVLHGASALALVAWLDQLAGPRAAIFGAALWALMPWDVLYADRIWLGNVMGPFGLVTLVVADRAVRHPAWQGLLATLVVVAPQIHMSAPALWIAVLVRWWLGPDRRFHPRAVALGLLIGAATYTPAILSELDAGFSNLAAITARAGGHANSREVWATPPRIFGYAWLSSTSEMSYHFERGYWMPFEERRFYGTTAGARAWIDRHGPEIPLALCSLLLGAWGWTFAAARLVKAKRKGLEPFDRAWVSILAGLGMATLLLMLARKPFFPHYLLYFIPAAILPVACVLAQAEGWRGRLMRLLLGASSTAMALNLVGYYRDVEALNDLEVVECTARRIAESPGPVRLVFTGVDNSEAVLQVLRVAHHQEGRIRPDSAHTVRVHNDRAAEPHEQERCGKVAIQETRG